MRKRRTADTGRIRCGTFAWRRDMTGTSSASGDAPCERRFDALLARAVNALGSFYRLLYRGLIEPQDAPCAESAPERGRRAGTRREAVEGNVGRCPGVVGISLSWGLTARRPLTACASRARSGVPAQGERPPERRTRRQAP